MDLNNPEHVLYDLYYNKNAFVGEKTLYKLVKDIYNITITHKTIQEWLNRQPVYQIHKQPMKPPTYIKNTQRKEALVNNNNYEMDLIFYPHYGEENAITIEGHVRSITTYLTIINTASKRAFVMPMRNKSEAETVKIMESLIAFIKNSPNYPEIKQIKSDEGSEFNNEGFYALCIKNNIRHIMTDPHDPHNKHARYIESFNKTIKNMIQRFMEARGTKRFVDALPQIMGMYHRAFTRQIDNMPKPPKPRLLKYPEFEVGDQVRVLVEALHTTPENVKKYPVRKGYLPKWTIEKYPIEKIQESDRIEIYERYYIYVDDVLGLFYPWELLD